MQLSNNITVPAGETLRLVLLNEPDVQLTVEQQEGSSLTLHILNLPSAGSADQPEQVTVRPTPSLKVGQGNSIYNDITIRHLGPNCETRLYALAYVTGTDTVTTHTHVFHEVGRGRSEQLIKFVLDDKAKGDFYGELRIHQDAQQVEAAQTNRNLLLAPTATMYTRPQLEIYADDVKASHGATTGQLDDSALFYMQQRGIAREHARRMLIGAFMKDVVLTIDDERQREELIETIDGIVQ